MLLAGLPMMNIGSVTGKTNIQQTDEYFIQSPGRQAGSGVQLSAVPPLLQFPVVAGCDRRAIRLDLTVCFTRICLQQILTKPRTKKLDLVTRVGHQWQSTQH